ncbi:hypothetical protein RHECNPAF_3340068 [Rhizobium etli CNPAF512]|nr:hypothetical protein RHECNPAF_3340068 [Rhizobium etli CNPAF512]
MAERLQRKDRRPVADRATHDMAGDDDDCARCIFRHGIKVRMMMAFDDIFDATLSTILHAGMEMRR